MSMYQTLTETGLPVAYGFFKEPQKLPYICYTGAGQENFSADDTYIYSEDSWQIEYYFKHKDTTLEAAIEQALLTDGYHYEKSEDNYIEDDRVFVIYYNV